MRLKYIFVVGGVMSGVGKGITTSSIGKLIQSRGIKVTAVKIDPYVNVDAGTMNPTEHGEVFVLNDGMECDQDMGNYERFLNCNLSRLNYMTTGSIYLDVINRERNLEFNGKCVEVVPHIPLAVINRINSVAKKTKSQVVIIEIGGTIGEYQNVLFLEAIRILKLRHPKDVCVALVSHLPFLGKDGELKTKPTQYATRTLNSAGIQPNIIIARAGIPLDKKRKEKLSFFCNINNENIISAPDIESIYDIPLNFERDNLSAIILKNLGIKTKNSNMKEWKKMANVYHNAKKSIRICIVGKYFSTGNFVLADSYISVIEAIKHACFILKIRPQIEWLSSSQFEAESKKLKDTLTSLKKFDGVIIPGGFGSRGVEGKINVIKYCRENKIPFFGLCYGMQLAVVEFCRSICNLKSAHTTEINPKTLNPVIDILDEQKEKLAKNNYGGTMRLGAYPAVIKKNTIAIQAYKQEKISERHRHRYEVNPQYIESIKSKGMIFSGTSPNGQLMEIIELPKNKHPFFVGVQFHPEFQSRPLSPHPLFVEFIKSALKK